MLRKDINNNNIKYMKMKVINNYYENCLLIEKLMFNYKSLSKLEKSYDYNCIK